MRHFAITGIDTDAIISRIFFGDAMRATPPSARICAGTRSSAITATAPARSAISACLASVTSIITPPLSISARPVFRRKVRFDDVLCVFEEAFGALLRPEAGFFAPLFFGVDALRECEPLLLDMMYTFFADA